MHSWHSTELTWWIVWAYVHSFFILWWNTKQKKCIVRRKKGGSNEKKNDWMKEKDFSGDGKGESSITSFTAKKNKSPAQMSPQQQKKSPQKDRSTPENSDKVKWTTSRAEEATQSSWSAHGKPFSSPNYELVTNVDHIISRSYQDVLNRHLATLSSAGEMQPTEAELHMLLKSSLPKWGLWVCLVN